MRLLWVLRKKLYTSSFVSRNRFGTQGTQWCFTQWCVFFQQFRWYRYMWLCTTDNFQQDLQHILSKLHLGIHPSIHQSVHLGIHYPAIPHVKVWWDGCASHFKLRRPMGRNVQYSINIGQNHWTNHHRTRISQINCTTFSYQQLHQQNIQQKHPKDKLQLLQQCQENHRHA